MLARAVVAEAPSRYRHKLIYLDYAAGSPLEPALLDELPDLYRRFDGNPSGMHATARRARQALADAREQLAKGLGAEAEQLVFTSGGTESNFLAIRALLHGRSGKILLSPLEHPSVVRAAEGLPGSQVEFLSCDQHGLVSMDALRAAADDQTALISITLASNEVGTVQNIAELRRVVPEVPFHCDAVQAVAKHEIDFSELGVDALTFSGHKFGAPKGIGGCLLADPTLQPPMPGGGQEFGLRGGTQNVVGAVAMARAWARFQDAPPGLAEWLRERLSQRLPETLFTGHPHQRLQNLVSVILPGIRGEALVLALDAAGIAVSTGSACSYQSDEVSRALTHLGYSEAQCRCSLRISMGRGNGHSQIEALLTSLTGIVESLRQRAC